jgi:hypothetical protein
VYGIKLAGSPQQTVLYLSNNDFYQNALGNYWLVADPTGKDGNISVDPKFLSRVAGDYHLLTGSPCIDAGDDAYLVPGEVDRDGRPRRIGAHVDMGAFEFGATFFTVADAARALRIAGGLEEASDVARLNVETTGAGLDVMDAVSILRKATGLEANP